MGPTILRIAIPGLTIVGVHICIVTGHGVYAISCLAAAAALHLVLSIWSGFDRRVVLILAGIVMALVLIQVIILQGEQEWAQIIALPPVLIHGWLAWMFGSSLLPGREPLIRRFSRLHRHGLPPELEVYTRRLTVLWTTMLSVMTVLSLALGLFADPHLWSWSVNIAMPVFAASMFLLEHAYRGIVYRHLGQNSPYHTLRTLLRPDTWIAP
ncbi:MAG: hypothetical protein P1V34_11615 [Alphaproteobacteria bacterium]|nr:hypothetical protein [Alphaproteobacteria bacterium]